LGIVVFYYFIYLNVLLVSPSEVGQTSLFLHGYNIISGVRSEKPGKVSNVLLEKDGEDQLDESCEK